MTDAEKVLISLQEKLDSLVESRSETKSSILDLVSQIKEVIHRISILERFDIKRIDRLETYLDILKDRLLVMESKGPPIVQELIIQNSEFQKKFLELKNTVDNIQNQLTDKNTQWKNIILILLQVLGTIISAIILYKLGIKL
jgi:hypothetical protein